MREIGDGRIRHRADEQRYTPMHSDSCTSARGGIVHEGGCEMAEGAYHRAPLRLSV